MSAANNIKSNKYRNMENIEFDFYKNPSKSDSTDEKNFHVRINSQQVIDLKELTRRIHKSCSMTPSDVHGVLMALKEEISNSLAQGQKVNIDGLCQFRLILGAKDAGSCSGKENGRSIGFKKIRISPYKVFNEETKEKMLPLKRIHANHSLDVSEKEIMNKLIEYFNENNSITRKTLETLCNITRYKANLYIKKLLENGTLENIGYKSHPVYIVKKQMI